MLFIAEIFHKKLDLTGQFIYPIYIQIVLYNSIILFIQPPIYFKRIFSRTYAIRKIF